MDGFKVRLLDDGETLSVQEVEEKLLAEHEASQMKNDGDGEGQGEEGQDTPEPIEIREEDVLSFIKNKYNRDVNNFEDLLAEREAPIDLPEDVSAFLRYKKDTGRGIQDFISLNRDLDKEDPYQLILQYHKETQPELDEEDLLYNIKSTLSYDEEFDDENEVRGKKIGMKKELAKAKAHFENLKEQYKIPVEQIGGGVPDGEKEEYEAFKSETKKARDLQGEQIKRSEFFAQKTDELFSDEFKGFEFKIEDSKFNFKPAEAAALKEAQGDVSNFFSKFLDKNGYVKDAAAYHKAIAVAMNPDSFAKHFYEQGMADAVEKDAKESKNIDMNARRVPESSSKSGFKVTALDSGPSAKIKIKTKN
jgi:hypothetical protein